MLLISHIHAYRKAHRKAHRKARLLALAALLAWLVGALAPARPIAAAQGAAQIGAVISAASFQPALAPEAIASVYGINLAAAAVAAEGATLPLTLADTQVRINDRPAQLFFVAPNQINFVLPANTAGEALLQVLTADGRIKASHPIEVRPAAPGIFSANANGQGVPAALALRAKGAAQTFETVGLAGPQGFQPKPLQFGAEDEQLVLILFLTGARCGGNCANLRVALAGQELTPLFVGPVPGLAGLDQINLELPRTLRGRSKLFVYVKGAPPSNEVELEFLPHVGTTPLRLAGFSKTEVDASEEITINGSGFAERKEDNRVTFGEALASVSAATPTQLRVKVPFGARSGAVVIETPQGKVIGNDIQVRTSLSGMVADASPGVTSAPVPLAGIKVRLSSGGQAFETFTDTNGYFVLKNLPAAAQSPFAKLSFDSSGLPQPFNPLTRLIPGLQSSRDNPLNTVPLQPINGPGAASQQGTAGFAGGFASGFAGGSASVASRAAAPGQTQLPITLATAEVLFELPAGNRFTPPAITINLTALGGKSASAQPAQSLPPIELPPGVYSSRIVLITPFDARFEPGGKLTFPNTEGLTANTPLKLYHFVQHPANPQQGQFVTSDAQLRADGKIETAANAIKEGGFYFVAAEQPFDKTKLLFGRVVERNGSATTPLPQALIQVQGQTYQSDGNGHFAPARVPFTLGKDVQVTASYRRQDGRVAYLSTLVRQAALTGEALNLGELELRIEDRPPVLLAPDSFEVDAGATGILHCRAYDPDGNRALIINSPDKPAYAEIIQDGTPDFVIRLRPNTTTDIGARTLQLIVSYAGANLSTGKFIALTVRGKPRAFKLLSADPGCSEAAPSGPASRLTWEPAPLATGYAIYRRANGGAEVKVGESTSADFTDKCLAVENSFENCVSAGGSYEYSVLARNASGEQRADNRLAVAVLDNICSGRAITVALPQVAGTTGSSLTIPINLGDLTGSLPEALAFEFELNFDQRILQFEGLEKPGSLSQDVIEEHNADPPGKLRVAAIVRQRPLGGASRTLLKLKFRLLAPGVSPLVWQRFLLNEGAPVTSRPQDGRVTVN